MDLRHTEPANPADTKEFYDQRVSFLGLGLVVLLIVVTIAVILREKNAASDTVLLVVSVLFLIGIILGSPDIVHNVILQHRGAPALRLDEWGIWSRLWSQLGWIRWKDIDYVVVIEGRNNATLALELKEPEFQKLSLSIKVLHIIRRILHLLLFFSDKGDTFRLYVANQVALGRPSWEELMANLDTMLAAHGVSKREEISRF